MVGRPLNVHADVFLSRQGTFTYAFLDYRGYGKSKDMPGEHSIKEIARDTIELADALGWKSFHLLGNSMGGHVAQYLAGTQTDRVKSVVLVNPVPVSGAPLEGDMLKLFASAAKVPESRATIFNIATGERLSEAWRKFMVRTSVDTTTEEAVHDYLDAWTNTNLVREVEGCKTPLKILIGARDPIITKEGMLQSVAQWFQNTEIEENPSPLLRLAADDLRLKSPLCQKQAFVRMIIPRRSTARWSMRQSI